MRSYIHCPGIIFGHEIQSVQSLYCQIIFSEEVKFEIYACGRSPIMRKPTSTIIHVCGMNAQHSYTFKFKMLGCRQIISRKMVILHPVFIELNGATTIRFM